MRSGPGLEEGKRSASMKLCPFPLRPSFLSPFFSPFFPPFLISRYVPSRSGGRLAQIKLRRLSHSRQVPLDYTRSPKIVEKIKDSQRFRVGSISVSTGKERWKRAPRFLTGDGSMMSADYFSNHH